MNLLRNLFFAYVGILSLSANAMSLRALRGLRIPTVLTRASLSRTIGRPALLTLRQQPMPCLSSSAAKQLHTSSQKTEGLFLTTREHQKLTTQHIFNGRLKELDEEEYSKKITKWQKRTGNTLGLIAAFYAGVSSSSPAAAAFGAVAGSIAGDVAAIVLIKHLLMTHKPKNMGTSHYETHIQELIELAQPIFEWQSTEQGKFTAQVQVAFAQNEFRNLMDHGNKKLLFRFAQNVQTTCNRLAEMERSTNDPREKLYIKLLQDEYAQRKELYDNACIKALQK